jgi:hypothetical protein
MEKNLLDTTKGLKSATQKNGLLVVYLVWSWRREVSGGWFQLESVSLTKRHAEYAKECAKRRGFKVVVEESVAEHLLGYSMTSKQSGFEPPDGYDGVDLSDKAAEAAKEKSDEPGMF